MKKVVFAITGSVAATRCAEIARELTRSGVSVECVMSEAATHIIHPDLMHWACGRQVITHLTGDIEHVRLLGLEGEADMLLICPATSNTISKIACGIDDTPVTTMAATALGSKRRILVAPAMHESMYLNPFVSKNIKMLEDAGVGFIGPVHEENKAKIASNDDIVDAVLGGLDE